MTPQKSYGGKNLGDLVYQDSRCTVVDWLATFHNFTAEQRTRYDVWQEAMFAEDAAVHGSEIPQEDRFKDLLLQLPSARWYVAAAHSDDLHKRLYKEERAKLGERELP